MEEKEVEMDGKGKDAEKDVKEEDVEKDADPRVRAVEGPCDWSLLRLSGLSSLFPSLRLVGNKLLLLGPLGKGPSR